jgi:dTMP kinase
MFIVIEGQDAAGKDTQAAKFVEYFKEQGKEVVTYSESGTTSDNPFIKGIAELNYGKDFGIEERTHALLYLVNRYEQWAKIAEPVLKRDGIVIITRNWLSTLIYEGYMLGVSRSLIARLHKEVMPEHYFKPDKIVILTLSDKERAKRLISQGKRSEEFFKSKDGEFQKKLNDAYLKVAKQYKIPTFDTTGSPDEVFERLKKFWNI